MFHEHKYSTPLRSSGFQYLDAGDEYEVSQEGERERGGGDDIAEYVRSCDGRDVM